MKTMQYLFLLLAVCFSVSLHAGLGEGKHSVLVRGEVTGNQMTLRIPCTSPEKVHIEFPTHSNWNLVSKEVVPGGVVVVVEFDGIVPSNGKVVIDEPWVIVGIDNITGVRSEGNNNDVSITKRLDGSNTGFDETGSNETGNQDQEETETEGNDPELETNPKHTTKSEVSIYPNPVSSKASVVTVGEILLRGIEVYDLSGRKIGESKSTNNRAQFDLSGYHNGVYMVMVHTNEGTKMHKIYKVQ